MLFVICIDKGCSKSVISHIYISWDSVDSQLCLMIALLWN